MATIPIEIILQDAEVPVDPTPTPEEETNIVVPDTGTISNEKDSGGTSSSVGIILPIVIAILAIVTVIVLMARKHHNKHFSSVMNKKEKLATVASSTIAILAVTVLVGNLLIPATNAATSVEPGTAELETVGKITITATREADNDSDTITATVKNTSYATANLDFGYKVTASMTEGLTTANLYLDGDETSEYYIAPVEANENNTEEGIRGAELANNTWGYTLEEPSEDTTYLSIPLANDPTIIVKGTNEIEDEAVDIYYTIKVDNSLPSGTYIGELEYTLTDNNFPSTLTTMQGMTTEICENTFTPGNQVTDPVPTATLEDTRDHKTYTIAKLADGNCWMTQNLDLDLNENTTLTPADTNVSENWTPLRSTINFTGTTMDGWQNDYNTPYSANPGDVYYYTSGTDADDIQYNSLAECEAVHDDGTCQHYHAGNYYNWSAAVASNDTSGMTEQYYNAPDSICPAGWRLPKNRNAESWTEGNEQDTMISIYEGIVKPLTGDIREYYPNGFEAIRISPIWLNRTGTVFYGSLSSCGKFGTYYPETVAFSYASYHLSVRASDIRPSSNSERSAGSSVRCIAQ